MKKILIVEGNLREENKSFSSAGIQTHTESLKDSLAYFIDKLETHVINPSSDENIEKNIKNIHFIEFKYLIENTCYNIPRCSARIALQRAQQ